MLVYLLQMNIMHYSDQIIVKIVKQSGANSALQQKEFANEYAQIKSCYSLENTSLLTKEIQVKYIQEDYNNFIEEEEKNFIAGGYFIQEDIENKSTYMIIDEALANAYFGTTACIGRRVEWKEESYTIIGVVQNRKSIRSFLNNMRPTVYLPYSLYEGRETYIIYEYEAIKEIAVMKELNQIAMPDVTVASFKSNSIINPLINFIQVLYIVVAILFTSIYIHLFRNAINMFKEQYRLGREKYYLYDQIIHLKGEIFKIGLFIIGGIFIGYGYTKFELRWDNEYIPASLGVYEVVKQKILALIQARNEIEEMIVPVTAVVRFGRNVVMMIGPIILMATMYITGKIHKRLNK